MILGKISAEMLTEKLVRRGCHLRQVKEILIERGYRPREWGFLCFLAVKNLYSQNTPFDQIRKFLIEREKLPAEADKGGVDYWLIRAIASEKIQENLPLKKIVEFLKYLKFNCRTIALALEKIFPGRIYLWGSDLDLVIINNGEQASEIVDWAER